MPSAVGYQPTLAEEMGILQERITSTETGSITRSLAGYRPAEEPPAPPPGGTLAHAVAVPQHATTSPNTGSTTPIPAVSVPADDLTAPSPATAFARLDATV